MQLGNVEANPRCHNSSDGRLPRRKRAATTRRGGVALQRGGVYPNRISDHEQIDVGPIYFYAFPYNNHNNNNNSNTETYLFMCASRTSPYVYILAGLFIEMMIMGIFKRHERPDEFRNMLKFLRHANTLRRTYTVWAARFPPICATRGYRLRRAASINMNTSVVAGFSSVCRSLVFIYIFLVFLFLFFSFLIFLRFSRVKPTTATYEFFIDKVFFFLFFILVASALFSIFMCYFYFWVRTLDAHVVMQCLLCVNECFDILKISFE